MPRKQRVYGSIDSLSIHYQSLLLVMKTVFPDDDCTTMEGITALSKRLGVDLPESLDPKAIDQSKFIGEPMTISAPPSLSKTVNYKPDEASVPNPLSAYTPSDSTDDIEEIQRKNDSEIPTQVKMQLSVHNPFINGNAPTYLTTPFQEIANQANTTSPSMSKSPSPGASLTIRPTPDIGLERIIYDRAGLPHYAGSIGSMAFFDGLCKIIRRFKSIPKMPFNGSGQNSPSRFLNSPTNSNSPASDSDDLSKLLSFNVIPRSDSNGQLAHHYGPNESSKSQLGIYFYTLSASTFSAIGNVTANNPLLESTSKSKIVPVDSQSKASGSKNSAQDPKSIYHNYIEESNNRNEESTGPDPNLFPLRQTTWDIELHESLPTRKVADELVASFFQNVNPIYTLFNMNDFMERYNKYWDDITQKATPDIPGSPYNGGLNDSHHPIDFRCCLYMVYVIGSRPLIKDDDSFAYYSQFSSYSTFVEKSVFLLIATPTTNTIQALFLLSLYLYGVNERNIAWLIAGLATRLSISSGLHRESAALAYSYSESQTRKMIWWTLYALELNLSANLGRPSSIHDEEVDISIPVDPGLNLDKYYPPGALKATIRTVQLLNLTISQQSSHISDSLSHRKLLTHETMEKSVAMCRRIKDFMNQLPPNLRELSSDMSGFHIRSILNIHMHCHFCISIVSRPYILYLIGSDPSVLTAQQRTDAILLFNIGCAATTAMTSILSTLHYHGLVSGVFHYDIYHGYCAMMVLALASLIVSSGKFSAKELAYDYDMLTSSIRKILKVMDSVYLQGTMLRLAKVTAYILRDLGIDYELGDSGNVPVDVKGKGKGTQRSHLEDIQTENTKPAAQEQSEPDTFNPASPLLGTAFMDVENLVPAVGSIDSDMFLHSFFNADDYERMFSDRDTACNSKCEYGKVTNSLGTHDKDKGQSRTDLDFSLAAHVAETLASMANTPPYSRSPSRGKGLNPSDIGSSSNLEDASSSFPIRKRSGNSQGIFDSPLPDLHEALDDKPLWQSDNRKRKSSVRQFAEKVQMEHKKRRQQQRSQLSNPQGFNPPSVGNTSKLPFPHISRDPTDASLYSTYQSPSLAPYTENIASGSVDTPTSASDFEDTPPGIPTFYEALNTFNCTSGKFVKPPPHDPNLSKGGNVSVSSIGLSPSSSSLTSQQSVLSSGQAMGKDQAQSGMKSPQEDIQDNESRYEGLLNYLSQPELQSPQQLHNQLFTPWMNSQNLESFYGLGDSSMQNIFASSGSGSSRTNTLSDSLSLNSKNRDSLWIPGNPNMTSPNNNLASANNVLNMNLAFQDLKGLQTPQSLTPNSPGPSINLGQHQGSSSVSGVNRKLGEEAESEVRGNGVAGTQDDGTNGGMGVISKMAYSAIPDHGKNLIDYIRRKLK